MATYEYHNPKTGSRRKRKGGSGKLAGTVVLAVGLIVGGLFILKNWRNLDLPSIPGLTKTTHVYVDPNLLGDYKIMVEELVATTADYELVTDSADADISIWADAITGEPPDQCETLYKTDLFLVARFATLYDGLSTEALVGAAGGSTSEYTFVEATDYSEEIGVALDSELGDGMLTASSREALVEQLEKDQMNIALVPASWLGPELKILEIDGDFPLDVDGMFRASSSICAEAEYLDPFVNGLMANTEEDFVDLEATSTVIQTGVTAMGRNLYTKMKAKNDPAWVARNIGEFLSDADLTHTSNEVSFKDDCSQAAGTMTFCADPDFIAALELSGIDLVELTGNHNNDKGRDAATYSIELYDEAGIDYFGGGKNLEDAQEPYIVDLKGTRIGFLGYNYYDSVVSGNPTPLATTTLPGANRYSEETLEADITALREEVDIIVVDFQFQECWCYSHGNTNCYRPGAVPNQQAVFRKARDLGADIVVGTQAHQPQGFEMSEEGAIFYGLGNLYFDQTVYLGTREELVIKHYFSGGQHLTTRVYTAMYDREYQPEIQTGDAAAEILEKLFVASGWDV